jgi:hypothetical protein
MLKWFGNLFNSRTAVSQRRDNAALQEAVQQAAVIYDGLPGKDSIDESTRHHLARQLFLDLHEIFSASTPVDVARQKLASQVLRLSLYQVLLIPPPPENDASGLRGLPGITGDLNKHLDSIVRKDSDLHSALFENAVTENGAAIEPLLLRSYWQCCWYLETFNSARQSLGDVVEGQDWFRPFLFAACANQENTYRLDIGRPPAFDSRFATTAPVAYSLFADIVLSGAKDPLQDWIAYHDGAGIPMPEFSDSTSLKY